MSKDDLDLILTVAEFSLNEAEKRVQFVRLFLGILNTASRVSELRSLIAEHPDPEEAELATARLRTFEAEAKEQNRDITRRLLDGLAREQSDQDRMAAAIAAMRALLPPGPEAGPNP